ncbi:MAG TPA: cytochrome c biogenesis protein CcsA [Anaeromyxobacter sp.]
MSPIEAVLYWAALALYAVMGAAALYALVFKNDRFLARAWPVTLLAFALHTGAIAARYAAQGHLPWAGDYEDALFGGWFIVGFTVAATWRTPSLRIISVGTFPLTVLLMGYGVMRNPTLTPLAASLRSSWLYVHVFFAWLAFGSYALAMGAGVVHEAKRRDALRPARNPVYERFPPLERLDELMFRWIAFGFVTDAVMIVSGAIWARDLWGSYWSWDPVETWSLVTFLTYGLAIHLRVTRGWRGSRFAKLAMAGVVGMVITFFGVNFVVESSSHFFNVR